MLKWAADGLLQQCSGISIPMVFRRSYISASPIYAVRLTHGNTSAVGEYICPGPVLTMSIHARAWRNQRLFRLQVCRQYQAGWLRGSKQNEPLTTSFWGSDVNFLKIYYNLAYFIKKPKGFSLQRWLQHTFPVWLMERSWWSRRCLHLTVTEQWVP